MGRPNRDPFGYESEYEASLLKTYQPYCFAVLRTNVRERSCSSLSLVALKTIPSTSIEWSLYESSNAWSDRTSSGRPIVDRNSGFTGTRTDSLARYAAVVSIESVGGQS